MKKVREVLVQYLSMLNLIKSKMNFGKDEFSIKVEFSWRDVLKNDYWTSYNINYEYFNCMFNLAVASFNLGMSIPLTDEDIKLKESIKVFQQAAWLFDNIKNELPTYLSQKETPCDLSANYLSYVK